MIEEGSSMLTWQLFMHVSFAAMLTTAAVCFVFRRGYAAAPLSYILSICTANWLMVRRHPGSSAFPIGDPTLGIFMLFWTWWLVFPALILTYSLSKRVLK